MNNQVNLDGASVVAQVAHKVTDVISIYPITPSSAISELTDHLSSIKEKNIWGRVPSIMEMQSEGGAIGACHGSINAGALTTTFTSSQGLLLMIPTLYKIVGEMLPFVIHVASRAVAGSALSIFGDHQDVMSVRQTGIVQINSKNQQESGDMALISHSATLKLRLPVMHFFEGFRTSHEIQTIEPITDETIKAMMDEDSIRSFRELALTPDNPTLVGTSQNPDVYFQGLERANEFYLKAPSILQDEMDKFASLTGRQYKLIEYHGVKDAEKIIVSIGSADETVEETIEYLNSKGAKLGAIMVRLYRPFPVEQFIQALPATTKSIAVLDRTKEHGSVGEPLYVDVRTAIGLGMQDKIAKFKGYPTVVGGRYGLGSKEFTPGMVKAVIDNLDAKKPKNSFSVGIHDDVTHNSLDYDKNFFLSNEGVYESLFFGLGSDGTVSANKSTAKIIGDNSHMNIQAYFVYDSNKAGSLTVSHLRFSEKHIRSRYLVEQANFIGCHKFDYISKHDMLNKAKVGSTFLLNSHYSANDVWDKLPKVVQDQMIDKHIKFYVVDAVKLGKETGVNSKFNLILQTAFFKLMGDSIIPVEKAFDEIKRFAEKSYGKFGEKVVQANLAAIEAGKGNVEQVFYPGYVEKADVNKETKEFHFAVSSLADNSSDEFIRNVTSALITEKGEELPVSSMPLGGRFPTGTSKFQKRGIASDIPIWDKEACIQCGICSFVCPHAAIRTSAYDKDALKNAPDTFEHLDAKGKGLEGMGFTVQVSPLDCTGCNLCVQNCPAKSKTDPNRKAINMAPIEEHREVEKQNFEFFTQLPEIDNSKSNLKSIKGTQLKKPLMEYSGACPGCGETPYIKLVTQMFGDRMLIANATGCSSIYGGNLPTTPYTSNDQGFGPAWGNSLFENNAEYGLGMKLALNELSLECMNLTKSLSSEIGEQLSKEITAASQTNDDEINEQRARVHKLLEKLKSNSSEEAKRLKSISGYLVKKSLWIFGGDGWAYDIGFGGLDHVIAHNENVNILVLDTELYSNTGGQASKSTPLGATAKFAASGKVMSKKDLGAIAMTYRTAYVAHVSMANPSQLVKALNEAESYDGPSIVIAYSSCIEHGIPMALGVDYQKLALETGYLQLYRYDPRLVDTGKPALQIDSKPPTKHVREFLKLQNRFRITEKHDKQMYDKMVEETDKLLKEKYLRMQQISESMD